MIKFLFDNFKDFPVIGNFIKGLYVGSLVKELIEKGKHSPAKEELKGLTGDELESAMNDEANQMFDETITPVITQYNVPQPIVDPIKEKAIEELVKNMREKADKKI